MGDLKVRPAEMEMVLKILRTYVPRLDVWAFGSRVHGENLKPFSDLDLAIMAENPLDPGRMAELKEAFTESALPFKVDVLDWSTTGERFRQVIKENYVVVQKGEE
ncbi:MAG: nucleotidyltransferase family protein [Geoalkalibacter sp.]|jgi:predicted nucleotidyltransferase|uniref:nucleotidyltransferase family protein n=1 Tax=Geoalkalibacter sp. TaxID=3041440 RepID=UPI003D14C9F0